MNAEREQELRQIVAKELRRVAHPRTSLYGVDFDIIGTLKHLYDFEGTDEELMKRVAGARGQVMIDPFQGTDLVAYLEMARIALDMDGMRDQIANGMDLDDEEIARLGKQLNDFLDSGKGRNEKDNT